MTKNLTDKFCAGIRSAERENVFDKKTRGLVLRVSKKSKVWYFTYRNGGPSQWLRLGDYPAVKLAEARTLALEHRHAVDVEGKDPAAERRTPPPEPVPEPELPKAFTFADFVASFVLFQKGKKKTWRDDENMIARYLTPAWGPLPLKDITRTHIHEMLDAASGKGLTIGVNRLQALISRIFIVALDRSLIDANPASKIIKRFDETPREVTLTDDQIRALWSGLDAHPGAAADAIKLRLLLGQRGEQTVSMLRAEVDLDTAVWTKPRRKMKRKKGAGPHAVALPPTALAIVTRHIESLPDDEPRIFPGLVLTGDEHKALTPLRGAAYEWIDLRRTVATRLADLRFGEEVIDRVLDHARTSVTSKHYVQHQYVDEIRRALTAWDEELRRILTNKAKKKAAVLRMRAR